MTTIKLEKKIFGSLVHTQGDTVLAYTDAVSHQADVIGMMLNGIGGNTLPKDYAALLFMFNPESQRYTFIHYQGSHVEFPENARYYTTRCIYETSKEEMASLDYLYSNVIQALPHMQRQERLNLNASKEINVEHQLPYEYHELSHEERTIYRHILASIANNTQLWIQLDNQYSDYKENGVFQSPKLKAILKAIDTLPRELRIYASLAFSTNGVPQNLIEQSLIVAYHTHPNFSVENIQGIHLDWSQQVLISPSSPSVKELKHVPQIAPLIPLFLGNVTPYRANVFKLISLIKKNIDKIISLSVNEMTENNITLCTTISEASHHVYRQEEIIEKLADCMISHKKEVTPEEFLAFVERHPHLQNQTRIIQYLSREIQKKKGKQFPMPTEYTEESNESPDIPIWDEGLSQKMGKRRLFPIPKTGFMTFYNKHKKILALSIFLLLVICSWVFKQRPTQTPAIELSPSINMIDTVPNDSLTSDSIRLTTDSLSVLPMDSSSVQSVDSSNINILTQNRTL